MAEPCGLEVLAGAGGAPVQQKISNYINDLSRINRSLLVFLAHFPDPIRPDGRLDTTPLSIVRSDAGAGLMTSGRFWYLAAIIAAAIALPEPANARLQFQTSASDERTIIIVSGEIEFADDLTAFEKIVQSSGAQVVTFDSIGGNPYKAMELGRLIRRHGLGTIQIRSGECASACALAFLGGTWRAAMAGAIGVHRSSFSSTSGITTDDAVSSIQALTADIMIYVSEMGADPSLLQLALQYDSDDMRYLSRSEMQKYRVTISSAEGPATAPRGAAPLPPRGSPAAPLGELIPTPTETVATQLASAEDAARAGDFNAAYSIWAPLAQYGNALAQHHLGVMYYYGEGVQRDLNQSLHWHTKASEQGNADSMLDIGVMHSNGDGVPRDGKIALQWFLRSADRGNAKAQLYSAMSFRDGIDTPKDYEAAVKYFLLSAQQDNSEAQLELARISILKNPPDIKTAIYWGGIAAINSLAEAQLFMGNIFLTGKLVTKDQAVAAMWFTLARGYVNDHISLDNGKVGEEAAARLKQIEKAIGAQGLDKAKAAARNCYNQTYVTDAIRECGLGGTIAVPN